MTVTFGGRRQYTYIKFCWCVSALALLIPAFTYWRARGLIGLPLSKSNDQHSNTSFDGFPKRTWNIRYGKLLYLVMGDKYPPQRWLDRSRWKDISVLYTSWKVDVREKLHNLTGSNLRVTYYPKSTWTTGRNHQLQQAILWEQEQKFQFETFIFFDADIWLLQRIGDGKDTIVRTPKNMSDDESLVILNRNLRRDRPLQATVMYKSISEHATCINRCRIDHAVVAFHRTAVELTLPYIDILDSESWWYSAAIQNYFASAVYRSYCVQYQNIGIDDKVQDHGPYPQGGNWMLPLRLVVRCLAKAGFYASLDIGNIKDDAIAPDSHGTCREPYPANVDYYAIARKQRWLRYLYCQKRDPQPDIKPTSS